jgi:UDP-N-acetylmuramate--alanine ligase
VKGDYRVKTIDLSGKPFHFIGIGGIGMSALAYILAKRHLPVSGSDLRVSSITERLQSLGARIYNEQSASNLECLRTASAKIGEPVTAGIARGQIEEKNVILNKSGSWLTENDRTERLPQVICSTAIGEQNQEYQAAVKLGCPIFHRSDVLAALIKEYQSVAVSGTHGKTTTSSLISYMLFDAGLDPTVILGGEVNAWEGNARLGEGEYLVAEADESDGTLVKHNPAIGVITNIELDHTDRFHNLAEVIDVFKIFSTQCDTLVGCIDDPVIKEQLKPGISYSINPESEADYLVKNVEYSAGGSRAEVWEKGTYLGIINLKLLGEHNLSNALAAVAVGRKLNLDFAVIARALANFEGAKRRFEQRGECNQICFIDDYAHHPSEIRVTLAAAQLRLQQNGQKRGRAIAIFQPHRYSRTQTFFQEFAQSFSDADIVVVTDIYSAGEENSGLIDGQMLADAIARHNPHTFYHGNLNSLGSFLKETILQPGDLALFLGAGNLNQIIPDAIALYSQS